ncbi:mTERF protein [Trifolium pratense]|uniref:mTERF protein n=1 Tax=Trifolium pratense TaxID=57577 RepID=A0A2K3PIF2_TRIPR|nr:mTERF protein [Trifolium pratense]
MLKAFLCYNAFGISTTTLYNYSPSQFSVKCLTTTTTPPSNSFSPESAIKASNKVIFKTSKKSESVINFFRTHGFTDSDIQHIIQKEPWLLNCNPSKRLLPKFQFLLSKGASTSDIVRITVAGHRFLQIRPYIFGSTDLIKSLEEVKGLGFDPSRTTFGAALIAKKFLSEELWDEKVDTFKKWGWSDEDIVKAFRVKPDLLLNSVDKINLFGEKDHSKGLSSAISSDERITQITTEATFKPSTRCLADTVFEMRPNCS